MMLVNLPQEIILNIIEKLNDCRDILAFYYYDKIIKNIIDDNLNNIVSKLIKNNTSNYYQMSIILKSCYRFQKKYIKDLILIGLFIFNNSKDKINNNSLDFYNYRFNNNKIYNYYRLRVFQNFNHQEAIKALRNLNINQILNMIYLIKMNHSINDAFEAASCLDKDGIQKMLLIIKRGIKIIDAVRMVNNLNDNGIEKTFELINKNIPVKNAIDAVEDLNDELIENMLYLFNNGVDADTARYVSSIFINENEQNEFIYLINKNVDKDLALDIIDKFNEEQIAIIKELMNIGINCNLACNIIQIFNETSNDINIIIKSYKNGLNNDNDKLHYLINTFDIDEILHICSLMEQGFDYDTALDNYLNNSINMSGVLKLG